MANAPKALSQTKIHKSEKKRRKHYGMQWLYGRELDYVRHFIFTLIPVRFFMILLLRNPLALRHYNRQYHFTWSILHPFVFPFYLSSVLIIALALLSGYNIVVMWSEYKITSFDKTGRGRNERRREWILIRRHYIPLMVVAGMYILNVVATINFTYKMVYMGKYYSMWLRTVFRLKLNVDKGQCPISFIPYMFLFLFIAGMVIFSLLKIGSASSSVPLLISIAIFRNLDEKILVDQNSTRIKAGGLNMPRPTTDQYKIIGGAIFLYLFFAGHLWLVLYLHACRALRNCFGQWNGRIYSTYLRSKYFVFSKQGRFALRINFKDHCALLDLWEGTNYIWAGYLETFYTVWITCLCFISYWVWWAIDFGLDRDKAAEYGYFIRPYDWAIALIFFFMGTFFIIFVTIVADEVKDEAFGIMDILRNRSLIERKTDWEIYFLYSVYPSIEAYKHVGMHAGHWFYLDKELLVSILILIANYGFVIYQFHDRLDLENKREDGVNRSRSDVGKWLDRIENIGIKRHWLPATYNASALGSGGSGSRNTG